MSSILLLWVGRQAPGPWEELAEGYRRRIAHFTSFSEVRVRPEEGRTADPARARRNEADRLRQHLKANDTLVVLDECGREMSSAQLSAWLSPRLAGGRVVIVIGSDVGTDEALRREAREVWSLSRLTLPHLLARLLVLEQLFRALDIGAGGGYHRE